MQNHNQNQNQQDTPNERTQKNINELGIKLSRDRNDLQEIDRLLTYVLCYPNIEEAQIHHRANNVGKNDLLRKQKQIQREVIKNQVKQMVVCQCCGILGQNDELKSSINLDEINLGVGVNLFFKNYFFHIIVFVLLFLCYSLFALVTNVTIFNQVQVAPSSSFGLCIPDLPCSLGPISGGSKVMIPPGNDKANSYSQIQSWIGVAFVILWGLMYLFKAVRQDKFVIDRENQRISAADFTLMLTHLPKQYFLYDENVAINELTNTKHNPSYNNPNSQSFRDVKPNKNNTKFGKDLKQYLTMQDLKKKFNIQLMDYGRRVNSTASYEVVKVNVAKPLYDYSSEYDKNRNRLKSLLDDRLNIFRNWIIERQTRNQFSVPMDKRDERYEEYMNFYVNDYEKHDKQQIQYGDENVVFLTMRSSQAVSEIAKKNHPPSILTVWNYFRERHFPIKGVKVRQAPQPEEIKWRNIGFPLERKNLRKLFTWLLTILLFGVSLGISIGIAFINEVSMGVSIGISIVVTCVNIGLQMSMVYLSQYQNQYVSSRQQTNIAIKIGLSQLLNSIGVPLIVTAISKNNLKVSRTFFKSGGLSDTVFFVAILNVLVPIVVFFDPWDLYLRVKRWYYSKPENRLYIHTQKNFNKYFGNYSFDIGYQYAYLIKTTVFTAFFVCMQPIIALFAPFGIMMYYFAMKRNLLYHYQRPSYHYATINKTVDFLLSLSLLAFGFGNLLVNNFIDEVNINNNTLLSNWIIVIIAAIFTIILPFRIFYCCIPRPVFFQHDYLDKQMLLLADYDRLNPLTKDAAIYEFKSYIDKLDQEHGLNNQAEFVRLQVNNQIENRNRREKKRNDMVSHISKIKGGKGSMMNDDNHAQNLQKTVYNDKMNEYKKIAETFQNKGSLSQGYGMNNQSEENMYPKYDGGKYSKGRN